MIYITNFKCGPDSYIKHFAREAAGAPLLILQFDGHGNDAGYMTRCEAYLDSKGILRCYQSTTEAQCSNATCLTAAIQQRSPAKGKRIYIPPMASGSARAFASAFRAIGLEAEPTPPSDNRTRELGARYTSGDECYPGEGHGGRLHEGGGEPGDRQEADRALHADRARSLPLRAVRAIPSPDSGCQRVRRGRDSFSHQPECVRRAGRRWPGAFVRTGWRALLGADLLQKLLLMQRPYEERAGEMQSSCTKSRWRICASTLEQTPAEPGVQLEALRDVYGARAATVSAKLTARGEPATAADRDRRRDLLPPEYVQQREPGARRSNNTAPKRG